MLVAKWIIHLFIYLLQLIYLYLFIFQSIIINFYYLMIIFRSIKFEFFNSIMKFIITIINDDCHPLNLNLVIIKIIQVIGVFNQ